MCLLQTVCLPPDSLYFANISQEGSMFRQLKYFFMLTKPTIMILVVITGGTALILEGSLPGHPLSFLLVLLALYLTGGSANALNQYFERDIDARMQRTAGRRPLPRGKISSISALLFSIGIGLAGVLIFGFFFNWYSALLSLATILFYSLFYTLYLKPNTSQNIVIGGIAGAIAPVGAWVAATGHMALDPWILFLIIFLWTPPHFWALALFYKQDYVAARLPMMPVVKGNASTLNQIIIYTWLVVFVSFFLLYSARLGWLYLFSALFFGVEFIRKSHRAKALGTDLAAKKLFGFSIIYLFMLFLIIIVDGMA